MLALNLFLNVLQNFMIKEQYFLERYVRMLLISTSVNENSQCSLIDNSNQIQRLHNVSQC